MPQFPTSRYSACPANGAFVRAQGSHSPMVEPDILPPIDPAFTGDHPFKITKVSISEVEASSVLSFKCSVGHVFGLKKTESNGPWRMTEDDLSVSIDDSTITEVVPGIYNPGVLDERNVGTYYSGTLDSLDDTAIYVRVKPDAMVLSAWKAELVMKSVAAAQDEYDTNPIRNQAQDDETLDASDVQHGGVSGEVPSLFTVTVSGAQDTYTFEIDTEMNRYLTNSKFVGEFHVPVAIIRRINDVWTIRQLLRSDIFFPYAVPLEMKYIDGYVLDYTGYGDCGP